MDKENIIKHFESCTDPRDKDFDYLIGELINIYPEIKKERGVSEVVAYKKNPKDWEDFDVMIRMSHRKVITPFHDFILYYSEENHRKICLLYEYYFEYKIEVLIDKSEAFEFIYPYISSIIYLHIYYSIKDDRDLETKNTPIIGSILYKLFKNDNVDFELDYIHQQYQKRLEIYVDSKLDEIDERNKQKSYELFFKDIPEAYRGMRIQM